MRLKVLIVPFFIVMILVLSIGYIKPDIDVLAAKQTKIAADEAQAARIEAIVSNISSLNNSLDTSKEAEMFMYRYLPATLAQEQAIDTFNFLALQSGVIIANMKLAQPPDKAVAEPLIDPAASAFIAGGTGSADADTPLPVPPVIVKTFILTGNVAGSYENIKAFFDRLAHTERFQEVRSFSLATAEKTGPATGNAAQEPAASLTGVFEAEYGYLPPQALASALSMPIFSQSKFDFSSVNSLLSTIADPVPTLEKGEAGKPNPFQ